MSVLNNKIENIHVYAAWQAVKDMARWELVDALIEEARKPSVLPKGHEAVDTVALISDALKNRSPL